MSRVNCNQAEFLCSKHNFDNPVQNKISTTHPHLTKQDLRTKTSACCQKVHISGTVLLDKSVSLLSPSNWLWPHNFCSILTNKIMLISQVQNPSANLTCGNSDRYRHFIALHGRPFSPASQGILCWRCCPRSCEGTISLRRRLALLGAASAARRPCVLSQRRQQRFMLSEFIVLTSHSSTVMMQVRVKRTKAFGAHSPLKSWVDCRRDAAVLGRRRF